MDEDEQANWPMLRSVSEAVQKVKMIRSVVLTVSWLSSWFVRLLLKS